MNPKILLCLALGLFIPFSNSFASESPTNSQPQKLVHKWEYISFPWTLPDGKSCPAFSAGWPGGSARSDEISRGLRLDIMNIVPGFGFFKTNAITAHLYRASGEIVEPTVEGKKLLNTPVGGSTFSGPNWRPLPQVMTRFPWGTNALEECWIEVSMGPERYWLEIPYGFDRNPADPLPPSIPGGPPKFASAMKSLTEHDHVLRWQNVHYDLGEIQNGWRLSLIQANPFDAESEVMLYKESEVGKTSWDLFSPRTTVHILDADGTVINGRCINIHLHDDNMRRTDTFQSGRHGDDQRSWGQIEISVDNKSYRVIVPSSLYKYIHGHASKPVATAFLSTLRVGMTLGEADQVSRNYNGIRNFTVSSAAHHQYRYSFLPDVSEVTLQFDESDRLVSWK